MTKIIKNYSSIKNIILLFVLTLLFNFIIFPISHGLATETLPLDLHFFYSPDKAYEVLEKYGESGRQNYLIGELSVDLIYPIIYTLMLCFSIFLLFGKIRLAQLPVLILISDYLENLGIVTMIYNYPLKLTAIARITAVITSIKWIFVIVTIIIMLYGLGVKIYAFAQQEKH